MKMKRQQRGVSLSGLIIASIVLGSVALVGMKLFPIYNEKFKVDLAMDKLASAPEGARLNRLGMSRILQNQFDVSDIDSIPYQQLPKMLQISEKGSTKKVTLAYEIRGPLFSNLDVIMKYSKTVEFQRAATD